MFPAAFHAAGIALFIYKFFRAFICTAIDILIIAASLQHDLVNGVALNGPQMATT